MALDELHARRLATLISVFEDALDRIEHLGAAAEEQRQFEAGRSPNSAQLSSLRALSARIRRRLRAAAARFGVRRVKPNWRQNLAAELSTLWVILENTRPERMKGYGREFTAQDRVDWESLVDDLMEAVEEMRATRIAEG